MNAAGGIRTDGAVKPSEAPGEAEPWVVARVSLEEDQRFATGAESRQRSGDEA